MKIDRHSYYKELSENEELILDKTWLNKALKCSLEEHVQWEVQKNNLEKIIDNNIYTCTDYLEFISLNNRLIAQDLRILEFESSLDLTLPMYEMNLLPHIQKSGFIKSTVNYTIVHYEAESFRLIPIAEKIKVGINKHFMLYEYKGNIASDNLDAIEILNKKYPNGVNIDGNILIVDDEKLDINCYYYNIATPNNINIRNAKPSFGVESVANILSNIIINIPEKSGMMIGVFGRWGRGKTYLINKICDYINKNTNNNFKRVNFSAWKYQDSKESWAYLFEIMINKYLEEDVNNTKIQNTFMKIKKLFSLNLQKHGYFSLASFVIFLIFSIYLSFFGGYATLIGIFGIAFTVKFFLFYLKQKETAIGLFNKYFSKKNYTAYLGLQAEVEQEIESLLKVWIPTENSKDKIILVIDDIDRCNIEQIINIVDGLRIILDNEEIHKRLLIITAIDEEILKNAFMYKYRRIDKNNINTMYQEYLEKVFIIGIKLNTLENDEIEEFLLKIIPEITNDKLAKNINNNHNIGYNKEDKDSHHENNINGNNHDKSFSKDIELTPSEKSYIIIAIKKLKNATPRKIKIFYYKYLISKLLFDDRLKEKNLQSQWKMDSSEKILMDLLIHTSNGKSMNDFTSDCKNPEILNSLKYSANMVSIL